MSSSMFMVVFPTIEHTPAKRIDEKFSLLSSPPPLPPSPPTTQALNSLTKKKWFSFSLKFVKYFRFVWNNGFNIVKLWDENDIFATEYILSRFDMGARKSPPSVRLDDVERIRLHVNRLVYQLRMYLSIQMSILLLFLHQIGNNIENQIAQQMCIPPVRLFRMHC